MRLSETTSSRRPTLKRESDFDSTMHSRSSVSGDIRTWSDDMPSLLNQCYF